MTFRLHSPKSRCTESRRLRRSSSSTGGFLPLWKLSCVSLRFEPGCHFTEETLQLCFILEFDLYLVFAFRRFDTDIRFK